MKSTKRRGKRLILTHQTIKDISRSIRAGATVKHSCALAGVGETTFYTWLGKGEEEDGIYREFRKEIQQAQEHAKSEALQMVRELAFAHGPQTKIQIVRDKKGKIIKTVEITEERLPSLQALTWLLERRWPKEFGDKRSLEFSSDERNPFGVSLIGQLLIGSGTTTEPGEENE